ncbi:MAG: xanthine dehydrogenase [Alphaproteobacteria bacterium]|nr:xanthine dehydrogenase [Alphaproteobacteria bacterium]
MKRAILDRLQKDRASKRPVALATRLADGAETIVYPEGAFGDLERDAVVLAAARRGLAEDRSGVHQTASGEIFVHVYNPALRLIIVGAVHIAQPLARMAAIAGYDVTIVDPRQSFANDERFPGVPLVDDWPDDALAALKPDRRTAVVTLTHDPKLDDPALAVALRSDAFYVGALGSRKTHGKRVERLTEQGFGTAEIGRIHGPVGLSLGAVTPAEIAVSILAQITQVLHPKDAA